MYEHQSNLIESKAEHMFALEKTQDDHTLQDHELVKDKFLFKKNEKEIEIFHMNETRALQLVSSSINFSGVLHSIFFILFLLLGNR